jgi:hypothetical protein
VNPEHGPGCPACEVEALTDEDREFLSSHGWEEPHHIVGPVRERSPSREKSPVGNAGGWAAVALTVALSAVAICAQRYHLRGPGEGTRRSWRRRYYPTARVEWLDWWWLVEQDPDWVARRTYQRVSTIVIAKR